jgi:hypothetical protein
MPQYQPEQSCGGRRKTAYKATATTDSRRRFDRCVKQSQAVERTINRFECARSSRNARRNHGEHGKKEQAVQTPPYC